jgi:hypothetical protein
VSCNFGSTLDLGSTQFDPAADVGLVVAPSRQSIRLRLGRRREQQDHRRIRALRQDLLGPLDVDLEEHVGPGRWVGYGRAHEVIEELGPLEESTLGNGLFEGGAIDEDVGVALTLARARVPRCPAPAQPEGRVPRDQPRGDCALAGPTRADEHENARLDDVRFSAQSL